jgi:tetratricopeptide (TPR) repeat protein
VNNIYPKPKLLFFQYKYDEHLPAFLLTHKREHVQCLSEFFEVKVIDRDCDYLQICDEYGPDLALFESGVPFPSCQRPKIGNIRACPQVPKLGFLHSDGFCEGRAGFLSDMDHLGIETFFAIATTAAEHTPEISDKLFVWPNFVDPGVYRDYGQWKNIPVLFTGNHSALYPWRQKLAKIISSEYPSLISPHPGYTPRKAKTQAMLGEPYARMLNASWFVPACGTAAKEVIRKHFEVPGCNACLITEKSAAIEAAGFVDMANCVFADEHNVLDKLDHLFSHTDELEAIIAAGYRLVHSRHTLKHRDQIFQWFNLQKSLKANEKIVQMGPFEPLRIADKTIGPANSHFKSGGLLLALLRQGDEKLERGKYDEAENIYITCLNYYRFMPEPQLRLALCSLYKGQAKMALDRIIKPIQFTLAEYKAVDPDPVEWAYFIISLLCMGKVDDAAKRCGEFPWLRHPELDRARWLTRVLKSRGNAASLQLENAHQNRFSVHQLPGRSMQEWVQHVSAMLKTCGQSDLAETLRKCFPGQTPPFQEIQVGTDSNREIPATQDRNPSESLPRKAPFGLGRKDAIGFYKRRLFYQNALTTLKVALRNALHGLEAKYGYFLPYRFSESRHDEFFQAIQALTREEDIKTVLIAGAVRNEGSTEALLAGVLQNRHKPTAFCISILRHGFISLRKTLPDSPAVKWYGLSSSSSSASLCEELDLAVKKIKQEHGINFFDVLLFDGSRSKHQLVGSDALNRELCEARFVILHDINNIDSQGNYDRLLNSRDHVLLEANPGLRNGYAIFEKKGSADSEVGKARQSSSVLTE